jgi:hypothetical protein
MMKIINYVLLSLFAFTAMPSTGFAQQIPTMDFFHGQECPHCQNQRKWLPTLRAAYPDIVINEYEVWHDTDNQALWAARLAEIGETPSGVPSNVIGDQLITGFAPDAILAAMEAKYGPPAVDVSTIEIAEEDSAALDLTLILIVLGGLGIAGAFAFLGKKS